MIIIPLVWILIAIIGAVVASNKNRIAAGWFIGCLLFPPLILLVLVLAKKAPKQGATPYPNVTEDTRKCPFCAETVKAEAILCKHCNKDLPVLKKKCSLCGAETEPGDEECSNGHKLLYT